MRSSAAPSKTAESDHIHRQDSCEFSSFETLLQGATGQFDIPPRPPATSAICAFRPAGVDVNRTSSNAMADVAVRTFHPFEWAWSTPASQIWAGLNGGHK